MPWPAPGLQWHWYYINRGRNKNFECNAGHLQLERYYRVTNMQLTGGMHQKRPKQIHKLSKHKKKLANKTSIRNLIHCTTYWNWSPPIFNKTHVNNHYLYVRVAGDSVEIHWYMHTPHERTTTREFCTLFIKCVVWRWSIWVDKCKPLIK
jgi:hypothetical protein